jgi:hypothetical protein
LAIYVRADYAEGSGSVSIIDARRAVWHETQFPVLKTVTQTIKLPK